MKKRTLSNYVIYNLYCSECWTEEKDLKRQRCWSIDKQTEHLSVKFTRPFLIHKFAADSFLNVSTTFVVIPIVLDFSLFWPLTRISQLQVNITKEKFLIHGCQPVQKNNFGLEIRQGTFVEREEHDEITTQPYQRLQPRLVTKFNPHLVTIFSQASSATAYKPRHPMQPSLVSQCNLASSPNATQPYHPMQPSLAAQCKSVSFPNVTKPRPHCNQTSIHNANTLCLPLRPSFV